MPHVCGHCDIRGCGLIAAVAAACAGERAAFCGCLSQVSVRTKGGSPVQQPDSRARGVQSRRNILFPLSTDAVSHHACAHSLLDDESQHFNNTYGGRLGGCAQLSAFHIVANINSERRESAQPRVSGRRARHASVTPSAFLLLEQT